MGLQPACISPPDYAVAACKITREVYESTDTLIFVQMLWLDLAILMFGFEMGSPGISQSGNSFLQNTIYKAQR